jgi:hypothetical protein
MRIETCIAQPNEKLRIFRSDGQKYGLVVVSFTATRENKALQVAMHNKISGISQC